MTPPKKRAAMRSAADMLEVGCPLPAAVVDRMEWMRSILPMALRRAGRQFCALP